MDEKENKKIEINEIKDNEKKERKNELKLIFYVKRLINRQKFNK